jgi:hypothetical protein
MENLGLSDYEKEYHHNYIIQIYVTLYIISCIILLLLCIKCYNSPDNGKNRMKREYII